MEVIREIREIDSDEVVIKIPKEFKKKKVEIVISPVEKAAEEHERFSLFLRDPIKIENFQMPSREERNAR